MRNFTELNQVSGIVSQLLQVIVLSNCILSILEFHWYQPFGDNRKKPWKFVILDSLRPHNCKTGHFTSWKRTRAAASCTNCKLHVQSVRNYCFSLLPRNNYSDWLNVDVNLSFSMLISTALLPVHLQCAQSTIKDASERQYSQNSHHFPNVHFQVTFSVPLQSWLLKGPHSPKIHCASRSANLNFVWHETFKKLLRSIIIVFFHYNRILHIHFNPPE